MEENKPKENKNLCRDYKLYRRCYYENNKEKISAYNLSHYYKIRDEKIKSGEKKERKRGRPPMNKDNIPEDIKLAGKKVIRKPKEDKETKIDEILSKLDINEST